MPAPTRRRTALTTVVAAAVATLGSLGLTLPAEGQASSTTAKPSTTTVTTTVRPSSTTAAPTSVATTTLTTATTAPSTTAASETTATDAGPVAPLAHLPFPVPLLAPVQGGAQPELAMTSAYQTASVDPARPQVVVQFANPFTRPTRPYRVSVYVGDPAGARLRASLLTDGGPTTTWKAEKGTVNGKNPPTYTTLATNTNDATLAQTGLVSVTVPLGDAPDGPAVWVEAESGTDGKRVVTSAYLSRAAFFGQLFPGQLPGDPLGQLLEADGTPTGTPVVLPTPPVVSLNNKAVVLTTSERPPTELAGQKVVRAYDYIRIAPFFNTRGVGTDYAVVVRASNDSAQPAGEVKLFDGFGPLPTDKSGNGQWLGQGPSKDDPGAPGTVTLDLKGVADALGIELSTGGTALGVRREFVLADNRRVVADGVLGTVGWFDAAALDGITPATLPGNAPVGPLETAAPEENRLPLILGVVGGILLLVGAIVIVVVRLRRRRARGDAADQLNAIATETAQHRAIQRKTQSVPVVKIDGAGSEGAPGGAPGGAPEGEGPAPGEPAVEPVAVEAVAVQPVETQAVVVEPAVAAEPARAEPAVEVAPVVAEPATDGQPVISAPVVTGESPAVATEAVATGAVARAADLDAEPRWKGSDDPSAEIAAAVADDLDQPSVVVEPPVAVEPAASEEADRRAPDDALAALGADLDELSARLKRLDAGVAGDVSNR